MKTMKEKKVKVIKKHKKDKSSLKKNILLYILLGVFSVTLLFSVYKIYTITSAYNQGTNTYQSIKNEAKKSEREIDFDKLKSINPDVIGWLYSKDTTIDYPVVQGSDNDYYLSHLFDNTQNSSGSVFMDYTKNKNFKSKNTILYAHNMKNGSMFASLMGYKDPEYYNSHKTLELYTPNQNYEIEVVYGFVIDAYKWDDNKFVLDENVDDLLLHAKSNTTFNSGKNISDNDKIITLSTCSYEMEEGRYVLIGKLIKK